MTIEDAITLAAERHRGQTDQAGEPYILHPIRVAQRLSCPEARLAAVLHDILEDTETTAEELLARGAPARVVEAVQVLTKRDGEDYPGFVARVAQHPLASEVKLADLEDNSAPSRLAVLPPETQARLRAKYDPALRTLREAWPPTSPAVVDPAPAAVAGPMTDADTSLAALKSAVADFSAARDWDRFHGPRDLAIGVVTEAAELLELFRFRSDAEVTSMLHDAEGRRRVEHELADVLFFLVRMAERQGIDLAAAFDAKMTVNAARYPVDKARGSNRKYTDL